MKIYPVPGHESGADVYGSGFGKTGQGRCGIAVGPDTASGASQPAADRFTGKAHGSQYHGASQ
jgi:hypothetical protein